MIETGHDIEDICTAEHLFFDRSFLRLKHDISDIFLEDIVKKHKLTAY